MGAALRVEDLVVRTAGGRVLVRAEALDLAPGASLGLFGPSGAGKSTFLLALAGLMPRTEGRVFWDRTDILSLGPGERAAFRAARMGMVFQDHLLLDELGALENAALASMFRPRADRAALKARAAGHLARLDLPGGNRSVAGFSGGERQRVAVARALANDASILLADEPTASLDRAAADALTADLLAVVRQGGASLVVVSHDRRLLDHLDRVAEIRDGVLHHVLARTP